MADSFSDVFGAQEFLLEEMRGIFMQSPDLASLCFPLNSLALLVE